MQRSSDHKRQQRFPALASPTASFFNAKLVLECAPLEQRIDIPESLLLIQAVSRLDLGYEIILALEGRKLLF